MSGWMKIGLIAFLVMAFTSLERPALAAPDVNEAKKESSKMLMHAKAMVDHGKAGHLDIMTKHAKEMIESAQKALDNIPAGNMHGESAADHIKSAIEHAKIAIDKQSLDQAEEALTHAKEGDKHAQQM